VQRSKNAHGERSLRTARATGCRPCCRAAYDPATCGYSRHATLIGARKRRAKSARRAAFTKPVAPRLAAAPTRVSLQYRPIATATSSFGRHKTP